MGGNLQKQPPNQLMLTWQCHTPRLPQIILSYNLSSDLSKEVVILPFQSVTFVFFEHSASDKPNS